MVADVRSPAVWILGLAALLLSAPAAPAKAPDLKPRPAQYPQVAVETDGLKLRLACPDTEFACRVRLRVRKGRRALGRRTVVVKPGSARTVKVRIARRKLSRRRSARIRIEASLLDEAGVAATTVRSARLRRR